MKQKIYKAKKKETKLSEFNLEFYKIAESTREYDGKIHDVVELRFKTDSGEPGIIFPTKETFENCFELASLDLQ